MRSGLLAPVQRPVFTAPFKPRTAKDAAVRGSDALGEAGPGLHPASSARGSSIARPHRRGTNAPFDPFCEATSYAAGNGVRSVGSL